MKAIFDTSSLHALAKYYIPLDKSGKLSNLIEAEISIGKIIIIDEVIKEARVLGGGVIITSMPFLSIKKYHTSTSNVFGSPVFYVHLNNVFINQTVVSQKKLTPPQLQQSISKYPNGADGKLIIYCESVLPDNPIIVTEESRLLNDGKVIKKIPLNCDVLGLKCCTVTEFLKTNYGAEIVV